MSVTSGRPGFLRTSADNIRSTFALSGKGVALHRNGSLSTPLAAPQVNCLLSPPKAENVDCYLSIYLFIYLSMCVRLLRAQIPHHTKLHLKQRRSTDGGRRLYRVRQPALPYPTLPYPTLPYRPLSASHSHRVGAGPRHPRRRPRRTPAPSERRTRARRRREQGVPGTRTPSRGTETLGGSPGPAGRRGSGGRRLGWRPTPAPSRTGACPLHVGERLRKERLGKERKGKERRGKERTVPKRQSVEAPPELRSSCSIAGCWFTAGC